MKFLPIEEQLTLIKRGVEEILPEEELVEKLQFQLFSSLTEGDLKETIRIYQSFVDKSSIEQFYESVKTKYTKVDFLINNAGVMFPPFTKTNADLELTFGVNYIGYYLLTNKIMPVLRDVSGSRVINISSPRKCL